mmetsp:Transcript_113565/g.355162  ORF Transcript_113565/g.355162 Transcript_113565/m.355162 type:complete len:217 (-) Transcript_113565:8-658(-)
MEEQDVLGLQILVHDALGVDVGDGLQALSGDRCDPALRQVQLLRALLLKDLVKLTTSGTLHDEVDVLVVLIVLEEPDDVRMIAGLQVSDLALQLCWRHLRLALVDGLQHTVLPSPAVADEVRDAEGAFSQLLHRLISETWSPRALLNEEGPHGGFCLGRAGWRAVQRRALLLAIASWCKTARHGSTSSGPALRLGEWDRFRHAPCGPETHALPVQT